MDHGNHGDVRIFAANASKGLAASIAKRLGLSLGEATVGKFSDGEVNVRVNETVRGKDVFIVQSTSPPVNDHLMELLIMIDAMKRSSAARITAVVPYFGYARQDRRARSHDPISARLVADMITHAGANRILSMDLHSPQIQGFFNIPFDHQRGNVLFAEYIKHRFDSLNDVVVVSPDLGSVSRCNEFADTLELPLAIVDKRRPRDNFTEVAHFIGDVEGKIAILLDDVISTGGSLCKAAAEVQKKGAKAVYACVTHPVLAGEAVQLIQDSVLEEVVFLDTVDVGEKPHERLTLEISIDPVLPHIQRVHESGDPAAKVKILSAAKMLSDAIYRIHNEQSLGNMYKEGSGILPF